MGEVTAARRRARVGAAGVALLLVACAADTSDPEATGESAEALAQTTTLLVSGDFAATSATKGIAQKELASNASAKLLAVGDLSYAAPYRDNYPWASWLAKTYPVMGNHEFNSVSGKGGHEPFVLFDGKNAAGNRHFTAIKGDNGVATWDFFYTHEVAPGWLLVVLNSGTDCKQQSCTAQATRMGSAIASFRQSHAGKGCVIAALHTARWSTMFSGDDDNLPWADGVAPIWSTAIANHVDLVLQGHVHVYEEFKKLGANGTPSASGAKLFTVGSGGRGQVKPLQSNIAASALVASRASPVNGVLKLALADGAYGYKFETAATTTTPAANQPCNVR